MDFHLSFPIPTFTEKINYSSSLLFIGSCFAENIGQRMGNYKFNVQINPNGVLYNPASIAIALRRIIANEAINDSELIFANDCWNSWEYHSRFSKPDKVQCLSEINNSIKKSHQTLQQTEWLFITFGSAFVYQLNSNGELVGNCHKIPQKEFTKKLLTVAEIISDYTKLLNELTAINNNLKVVFTVSPVRYIRDGVVENNISKARLTEAVHDLVAGNNNAFYFPAYELVIDDLRDYRFYKSDLVHPNDQAISYVFEKLMDATFDEETKKLFEKIKDIITAKEHRPFNTETNSHQQFKALYLNRCNEIQKSYPFLDLQNEIHYFVKS
jgi:GSCFA family